MTHFAVVFDKNYLLRAVALHHSIQRFLPEAQTWFLCLDQESVALIERLRLPQATAKWVEEINDPELIAIRPTRKSNEFAMSAKASWLWHLINTNEIKENETLIFADADILFYDNPTPAIQHFSDHGSVGITHHKFSPAKMVIGETVGYYNSGLIFFRNNSIAREVISDWRKQCIEWCYLYPDQGRHGDQKYLDHWPSRYREIYVLPQKGLNVGTWNLSNFIVTPTNENHFNIDDEPLVCYHFHGLKIYLGRQARVKAHPRTIHHLGIYHHYLSTLTEAYATIRSIDPGWRHGFAERPSLIRLAKQNLSLIWRILFAK